MEISQALQTVRSLADGIDPVTGEVFPDDSPYQYPSVIRSLYEAVKALEHAEERQRREQRLPGNAGKAWDDEEDKLLIERFDAAMSTKELAQQHDRTEGAVQARLEKLGKLPPTTRPRFADRPFSANEQSRAS
ncbi:MAG: hypothetical protein H0V62_00275 [Gammaproteobacteria bacterium]|nr:hypothetical protein [Gammaproteobacteria bacterium]